MKRLIDFIKGFTSILNIKPYSHSYGVNTRSDAENLASDWRKVGEDMNTAINQRKLQTRR